MLLEVLLLDEPFGALDALTRATLQNSVMEIQMKLGNTIIIVTHDSDEAVLLFDKIIMMTNELAATIEKVVEVNLSRPRDCVEAAKTEECSKCRSELLEFFIADTMRVKLLSACAALMI